MITTNVFCDNPSINGKKNLTFQFFKMAVLNLMSVFCLVVNTVSFPGKLKLSCLYADSGYLNS